MPTFLRHRDRIPLASIPISPRQSRLRTKFHEDSHERLSGHGVRRRPQVPVAVLQGVDGGFGSCCGGKIAICDIQIEPIKRPRVVGIHLLLWQNMAPRWSTGREQVRIATKPKHRIWFGRSSHDDKYIKTGIQAKRPIEDAHWHLISMTG